MVFAPEQIVTLGLTFNTGVAFTVTGTVVIVEVQPNDETESVTFFTPPVLQFT